MLKLSTALAVGLASLSINAFAVDVPTDGTWTEFDFGATGTSWFDINTLSSDFSFNISQNAVLQVVDLGLAGDRFEVFANGASLGQTSAVPVSSAETFDPASALADPSFSRGSWTLSAGNYTITGTATASPYDGGYAALSVTPVPEPESYALILAGLGLVGFAARRRRA